MKVLVISYHTNALSPIMGATTRSWSIIKALIKNKFDVSLIHSIDAKGYEDDNLKKRCKIHYHKNFKIYALREKYFNDLNPYIIYKLINVFRKEKFDIIQIEFPFGFFSLKLLNRRKSTLIYDSHGVESKFVDVSYYEERFPKLFYVPIKIFVRFYEKLVCKLADVIVTFCKRDKNYYVRNFKIKENKITVIQQPSSIDFKNQFLDIEKLKLGCRKKLNLPLDKIIVIFHGVYPHPPNKEAFDLIINYIAPKIKNLDIIVVLAGNKLNKFKKENIISLGFVEDLKSLLIAADFAIIPIKSGEGMRIKCSDYISAALPFISTKKGIEGIEFLEEGKDFLLSNTVNNEFIKHIQILAEDRKLRESMRRNLRKKLKFLNLKKFEDKFTNLYSKIIL